MAEHEQDVVVQLAIWKDKYNRLAEQHGVLFNQNQELEDRLINVVEKIERDKSLLSDEIDHLAEKLACATNTIDYMKNECARYKSDCMLAVHLLQCQPSFYSSQQLGSLPPELKEKFASDHSTADGGKLIERKTVGNEKKTVSFSASAMTFPPTAVFLPSDEPAVDESPPDEPDSRHDVRDVFLKKILLAPEYETEKLVQCPKCGYAVVKYDRCSQTAGDLWHMVSSRSAPHLHSMDDDQESDADDARKKRFSTTTSGDLLIDLSDIDRASTPGSPTFAFEGVSVPTSEISKHQVRFDVSPGVHHYHRSTNLESTPIDRTKRQDAANQPGARCGQSQSGLM